MLSFNYTDDTISFFILLTCSFAFLYWKPLVIIIFITVEACAKSPELFILFFNVSSRLILFFSRLLYLNLAWPVKTRFRKIIRYYCSSKFLASKKKSLSYMMYTDINYQIKQAYIIIICVSGRFVYLPLQNDRIITIEIQFPHERAFLIGLVQDTG